MSQDVQVKNEMCSVTESKIWRGMIFAGIGGVAVLLLFVIWQLGVDRALIASFITFAAPTIAHALYQFKKGDVSAADTEVSVN